MNAANVDDGDEEADDNDAVLNPVCPKLSDILEGFQVLHHYYYKLQVMTIDTKKSFFKNCFQHRK